MPDINYVEQGVNIYSLPLIHSDLTIAPGDQLIIGDLHANTIKLIYMLVRHGVLLGINEEQYDKLVVIYRTAARLELTQSTIKMFFDYLMSFQYVSGSEIVLIGDDLADRGACDYLTLLLYQILHLKGVKLRVLLSNHSIEAIEPIECAIAEFERIDLPFDEIRGIDTKRLADDVSFSLRSMNHLISQQIITLRDVVSRYVRHYRENLQLVFYLEEEGKLTILSHAPIGLNTIRALADHPMIGVHFDDSSLNALKCTIDGINLKVAGYIHQNQLHTLYSGEIIESAYFNAKFDLTQHPVECCLWNRRFGYLDCPQEHNGYSLQFVHGHCENTVLGSNAINLNTPLGQNVDGLGMYSIIYVTSRPLSLEVIQRNASVQTQRRASTFSVPSEDSTEGYTSDPDDDSFPSVPPSSPSVFRSDDAALTLKVEFVDNAALAQQSSGASIGEVSATNTTPASLRGLPEFCEQNGMSTSCDRKLPDSPVLSPDKKFGSFPAFAAAAAASSSSSSADPSVPIPRRPSLSPSSNAEGMPRDESSFCRLRFYQRIQSARRASSAPDNDTTSAFAKDPQV